MRRRDFFGITLGAGVSASEAPALLRALQQSGGKLIQRAIPSTGETLPVIGLGRGWSRSLEPAALEEVVRTFVDNGGKVLDTVHGGPNERQLVGTIANELGAQNKIFWSTGLFVAGAPPLPPGTAGPPPKADPAAVKAEIETLFAMFKVPKIDLIQVLAHADIPRRNTCSTTSAAASAACLTRRRGSAWRSWSTRGRGLGTRAGKQS